MTTIAFRDGTLCADSRAVSGSMIFSEVSKKLFTHNDGSAVATCGDVAACSKFVKTLERAEPDYSALGYNSCVIVLSDKHLLHYCNTGETELDRAFFYAFGSGAQAALAAMHMGANAEEAVRIASLVDLNTNDRLIVMRR